MKRSIWMILPILLLIACTSAPASTPQATQPYPHPNNGDTGFPEPYPYPAPLPQQPPQSTLDTLQPLRQHLAGLLSISPEQVTLSEMKVTLWSDGCLGAANPGEICTQAIVPGYTIILETSEGYFEYHTDETLRIFRLATPLKQVGSSPGLLVTWQRTGGFAGICQELNIMRDGQYRIRDCNKETLLAQGKLQAEDWKPLQIKANQIGAHTWVFSPPAGSADMFLDQYTWYGTGSQVPDTQAQEELNLYLAQLEERLIKQAQNNTDQLNSGIQGLTLIGPACPGPVQVDDLNCADKPFQATISILDITGAPITQVQTSEDGRFMVSLEPGMYVLRPETSSHLPTASEQWVQVLAGQYVEVIIQYDSGMR